MSTFDKAVEEFTEEYDEKLKTAEWVRAHNLDLAAIYAQEMSIYEDYATLCIPPNDIRALRNIRKVMGTGWYRYHQHANESGTVFINYRHEDNEKRRLAIIIDADLASQQCQKIQTGIKEVPVYEVVCG